jgi:hypothetical protein
MLLCTSCSWHPYTHLSLNTVVYSRPLTCVVVHTLAFNYHHRSLAAFFHSFTSFTLCVYFLPRIALSGLSLVVCLFLIGLRQRDICSAGLAQFINIKVFRPLTGIERVARSLIIAGTRLPNLPRAAFQYYVGLPSRYLHTRY